MVNVNSVNRLTQSSLYIASAIGLALLGGCGGGGSQIGTDFQDAGNFLGPGNTGLDPTHNNQARVGIFLVNEIEGQDKTLSDIGQQNAPAVALIDTDGSGQNSSGDQVRFNQVELLSIACVGDSCPGSAARNAAREQKKKRWEENLAELKKVEEPTPTQQQAIINLQNALDYLAIEEAAYSSSFQYVDVDNDYLKNFASYTVDSNPSAEKSAINDAGITKIDFERIGAQLVPTGGTIDRRFNGVVSLGNQNQRMIYYRQPAAAGWSYQTFFRYYSTPTAPVLENRRDLLQGYQSIGYPTPEMPKRGYANYSGITHALYNGDQVTMLNHIHADFASRNLDYKTNETAILHTFENEQHIIEKRPELNLTGSASWAKGVPDFQGRIRSADGRLNGTLQGRFYGSQAAEVGGIFGLAGNNGTDYYIGGFGAKRD